MASDTVQRVSHCCLLAAIPLVMDSGLLATIPGCLVTITGHLATVWCIQTAMVLLVLLSRRGFINDLNYKLLCVTYYTIFICVCNHFLCLYIMYYGSLPLY